MSNQREHKKKQADPPDFVVWNSSFESFKKDITAWNKSLENRLLLKGVGLFFLMSGIAIAILLWVFDYNMRFADRKNQAEFESLKKVVYTPTNETILKEIQSLKEKIKEKEAK